MPFPCVICPKCDSEMRQSVENNILKCETCKTLFPLLDDGFFDLREKGVLQERSLLIQEKPVTYNNAFGDCMFSTFIDSMSDVLDTILVTTAKSVSTMNILDIGCGNGYYSRLFKKYRCHYYGLEPSTIPPNRVMSLESISESSVTLLHYSPEKGLPVVDNNFDVALLVASYDHIPNRIDVLREIVRKIKAEGRLVIIMTNQDFWLRTILRRILRDPTYGSHDAEHFCEHDPRTLIAEVVSSCKEINRDSIAVVADFFALPNLGKRFSFLYFSTAFVKHMNRMLCGILRIVYKTLKLSDYGSSMIVVFQKNG